MSSSRTPSPTTQALPESTGPIFTLSDQKISQEIDFVEEIGNGNWGSVWLVRAKRSKPSMDAPAFKDAGRKFAVKLVHRKKTAANASRIKSLWNEMKIVSAFKDNQHPSIISFHSFVMTPSFAMISMTYLPTLIPVEVEEDKCREWFRFLLSGVDFLHRRGVVHNDIKPANILLSHKNIPVLVDFGFAELKDSEDDTSFHSNLTYGTPEYLSPERARGITHDTRKSDVWSLGVTFFEILSGRTPFEEYDGDALQTKDDVERYWSRTLRGKWVGNWSFSDKMEKLLRRMMSPNADLRCTASQAMADAYWKVNQDTKSHRRSSSYTSSVVFEHDLDKLLNMTPPKPLPKPPQESPVSPPGLIIPPARDFASHHLLMKSKSQPKVASAAKLQPRKRVPQVLDLSPIKGSPPTTPSHRSAAAKENAAPSNLNPSKDASKTRRPFGAVLAPESNAAQAAISRIPVKRLDEMTSKRRSGAFSDLRRSNSNLASESTTNVKKASTNVKDRVMEWEREKQRLREMERLEELERERDHHFEREKREKVKNREEEEARKPEANEPVVERTEPLGARMIRQSIDTEERQTRIPRKISARPNKASVANEDKENAAPRQLASRPSSPPTLPLPPVMSPLSRMMNTLPAPTPNNTPAQASVPAKQSKQNVFKHSIKASFDKTMQFYKSSSIGRAANGSTPSRGISSEIAREAEQTERKMSNQWKLGSQSPEASVLASPPMVSPCAASPLSPLAGIKNAAMTEQMAADTQMDRMTIWMKNVEKVVEEAQANFEASAARRDFQLPSLPLPPPASQIRQQRSTRLPRRILAASQIFDEHGQPSPVDSSFASNAPPSSFFGVPASTRTSSSAGHENPLSNAVSPTDTQFVIPEIVTPSRQRRATVSSRSPEPLGSSSPEENPAAEAASSNSKPMSRAHASLKQLRIAPLSMMDAGYMRDVAEPSPRLSEMVDRNIFIAQPYTSRDNLLEISNLAKEQSYEEEHHSSIYHVEPYPLRPRPSQEQPYLDTPDRQKLETVYDRFLMTSGVRRNGKGYQSEVHTIASNSAASSKKENHRSFLSSRKPMLPPVSSDDIERRAVSVDELGVITSNHVDDDTEGATPLVKDESNSTVALVRRAFKAMVPNKAAANRRLSRAY